MATMSLQHDVDAHQREFDHRTDVRSRIRGYIIQNLLIGDAEELDDALSLTASGIIDSAAMLELLAFLSEDFAISIADTDLTLANLDSVDGMVALVERISLQA